MTRAPGGRGGVAELSRRRGLTAVEQLAEALENRNAGPRDGVKSISGGTGPADQIRPVRPGAVPFGFLAYRSSPARRHVGPWIPIRIGRGWREGDPSNVSSSFRIAGWLRSGARSPGWPTDRRDLRPRRSARSGGRPATAPRPREPPRARARRPDPTPTTSHGARERFPRGTRPGRAAAAAVLVGRRRRSPGPRMTAWHGLTGTLQTGRSRPPPRALRRSPPRPGGSNLPGQLVEIDHRSRLPLTPPDAPPRGSVRVGVAHGEVERLGLGMGGLPRDLLPTADQGGRPPRQAHLRFTAAYDELVNEKAVARQPDQPRAGVKRHRAAHRGTVRRARAVAGMHDRNSAADERAALLVDQLGHHPAQSLAAVCVRVIGHMARPQDEPVVRVERAAEYEIPSSCVLSAMAQPSAQASLL